MRLGCPAIAFTVLLLAALNAQAGQYLPMPHGSDNVCVEIGMKPNAPSGCLLDMVNYKGKTCYKCRGNNKCNPACSGGKICAGSKCVCPPNSGLIDCNGMCVKSFQCQGLAAGRKGRRAK